MKRKEGIEIMRKSYPGETKKPKNYAGPFPLHGHPLYSSLTPNQKRFVHNVFQQPISRWSNAQCYSNAYGREKPTNSDTVEACNSLKKPKIAECVRLLQKSYSDSLHVSNERVLEEESYIAYSDIGEYFNDAGMLIQNPKLLPKAARRAIRSFKERTDLAGNITYEVELWNKGDSLKRLQSILGMNKPQVLSVNGKITHGGSVEHVLSVDLSSLSTDELTALDGIATKLRTTTSTGTERKNNDKK